MDILERLGNVIKSYINDGNKGPGYGSRRHGDPDLDAAYEELNDFLGGGSQSPKKKASWEQSRPIPAELRADFAELGLTPAASAGECKAAYKKLLKIHHPDRHAATEKSARINAAYERINTWRAL
jgi:DnaJ-domain-containing protein 1